jgi:hypothetical protein
LLFGIGVVGLLLDYFWNYLLFILGLRWLKFSLSIRRKHVYCILATSLGLTIDWLYYRLAWDSLRVAGTKIQIFASAGEQPVLGCLSILAPMVLIIFYILIKFNSIIIAIKPKPPFKPVFQVAASRGGSDIRILNEPLEGSSVFLVETGEGRTRPETTLCFV